MFFSLVLNARLPNITPDAKTKIAIVFSIASLVEIASIKPNNPAIGNAIFGRRIVNFLLLNLDAKLSISSLAALYKIKPKMKDKLVKSPNIISGRKSILASNYQRRSSFNCTYCPDFI